MTFNKLFYATQACQRYISSSFRRLESVGADAHGSNSHHETKGQKQKLRMKFSLTGRQSLVPTPKIAISWGSQTTDGDGQFEGRDLSTTSGGPSTASSAVAESLTDRQASQLQCPFVPQLDLGDAFEVVFPLFEDCFDQAGSEPECGFDGDFADPGGFVELVISKPTAGLDLDGEDTLELTGEEITNCGDVMQDVDEPSVVKQDNLAECPLRELELVRASGMEAQMRRSKGDDQWNLDTDMQQTVEESGQTMHSCTDEKEVGTASPERPPSTTNLSSDTSIASPVVVDASYGSSTDLTPGWTGESMPSPALSIHDKQDQAGTSSPVSIVSPSSTKSSTDLWLDSYTVLKEIRQDPELPRLTVVTHRETEELAFLKSITVQKLSNQTIDAEAKATHVLPEVAILSSIDDHSHIVKLQGFYHDQGPAGQKPSDMLLLEYCNAGDVGWWSDGLLRAGRWMPVPLVFRIISSVIGALAYLHEGIVCNDAASFRETSAHTAQPHRQILHRNIRPENLLMCNNPDDDFLPEVMLGGFGQARFADEDNHGICGDPNYHAPEMKAFVRLTKDYPQCRATLDTFPVHTPATDVFALGCTIWQLLTGLEWIEGTSLAPIFQNSHFGKFAWFDEFLEGILAPEPGRRWNTKQLYGFKALFDRVVDEYQEEGWRLHSLRSFMQDLDPYEKPVPDMPRCLGAYDMVRRLAKSTEGPVDLIRHKDTGVTHVVKHVRASAGEGTILRSTQLEMPDAALTFSTEAIVLSYVLGKHPNIITVQEVFVDDTDDRACHMVMEYCAGGDMAGFIDKISKTGTSVPEIFIRHFIVSMIDALAFIHQGPTPDHRDSAPHPAVVHRDIKLDNILLRPNPHSTDGLPDIVLADFGMACFAAQDVDMSGTWSYMAPELRRLKDQFDKRGKPRTIPASPATDIYALGVCIYALLTMRLYEAGNDLRRAARNSHAQYNCEDLAILMRMCLQAEPALRPSASELLPLALNFKQQCACWQARGGSFEAEIGGGSGGGVTEW